MIDGKRCSVAIVHRRHGNPVCRHAEHQRQSDQDDKVHLLDIVLVAGMLALFRFSSHE
jgi:hypothetical protein